MKRMNQLCRSLVVFALAAVATGTVFGQRASAPAPGTLTVRVGERTVILPRSELVTLTHRTVDIGEGADVAQLSGVSLWDVLQKANAVPATASGRQRAVMYVRLVGADGQNAVIALVEIDPSFSKRTVVLADQRAGRPLDDVEGPWRAIIPDDLRHARWIRGLVTISVESLK